MLIPERLRDQMTACGLTQAALARRVGVSQQTVGRLVTGDAYTSRYLHKIARELRTTPAYLTGETDNPEADAPDISITAEEREILDLMRALPPTERAAALVLIRSLATSARSPSVHG
ncbi:helix-turn-helix transcriptional regulator [uncultured Novosphingobium sp.]|uniref:helix-turn-helix domain-containing protein n=1 Tax=uncultured Novosphingobium sp. TaxID=292277 RepID=UPI00338F00DE